MQMLQGFSLRDMVSSIVISSVVVARNLTVGPRMQKQRPLEKASWIRLATITGGCSLSNRLHSVLYLPSEDHQLRCSSHGMAQFFVSWWRR